MRNYYKNPHNNPVFVSTPRGGNRSVAPGEVFSDDSDFYDRFIDSSFPVLIKANGPEDAEDLSNLPGRIDKIRKIREEDLIMLTKPEVVKIAKETNTKFRESLHRRDIIREIVRRDPAPLASEINPDDTASKTGKR